MFTVAEGGHCLVFKMAVIEICGQNFRAVLAFYSGGKVVESI